MAQFKLEMACVTLQLGNGGTMRALVLATAPMPGNPNWVIAGLALENGQMIQKPISKVDFELGAQNPVTLVEAKGEKGPAVLYGAKGEKLA